MNEAGQNPVLLIGWDAAEWQLLREFMVEGLMPNFESLTQAGSSAYLGSLKPSLSPLLWTSVITGKRAFEHGILSFVNEGAQGVEPVSSRERRVPALWNILDAAGLRSTVINWWPSDPPEKIQGRMVSQGFFTEGQKGVDTVYPQEEREKFLRAAQIELSEQELAAFFPLHSTKELAADPLVQKVATILRRSAQQLNVALEALEPGSFDLGAVYFEALDQIKHLAIKYHPPQLEGINDEDFAKYREIVRAAYAWHDMILGTLVKRVGDKCNILLISDHGFEVAQSRQLELADLPAAPASEHRPFGVLVAAGPDWQRGVDFFGASLLDVMPTLLHHFKIPLGEDLSGKVWSNLWSNPAPISKIPSWDPLVSPQFMEIKPISNREQLKNLEELGYWQSPVKERSERIAEEQDFNKAVSLAEAQHYLKAVALCEKWQNSSPQAYRWYVLAARQRLQGGSAEAWQKWYEELAEQWQESVPIQFLRGLNYIQLGDLEQALNILRELEQRGVMSPVFQVELGQVLVLAGQHRLAEEQFKRALELQPQNARALNGLAQCAFDKGHFEEFEARANESLSLKFFQPQLHYLWALHYRQQGDIEAALQALDLCLQLAPRHLKAQALKKDLKGEPKEDWIYVVSGFPRSGTSMMMAILEAAGLEVLSDAEREADRHNARGYYEWQAVQNLARGVEWPRSSDFAVKVVAPLLAYLPAHKNYKVVWMDRPTVEIILSQAKMKGEPADLENFPFARGQALETEKERLQRWLDQQANIEWQSFAMRDFFAAEHGVLADRLSQFLGREIQERDLAEAVDPNLRHLHIG